ncbi:MAG: hypothetical protein WCO23_03960 [bacterium]
MINPHLIERAAAALNSVEIPGSTPINTGYDWINAIFSFATTTLGPAVGAIVILYGAFKYITAGGDQSKTKEGSELIIGAILGYTILLLTNLLIKSLTM